MIDQQTQNGTKAANSPKNQVRHIVKDPMQCKDCMTIFCLACINERVFKYNKCPNTSCFHASGGQFEFVGVHSALQKILQQAKVRCRYCHEDVRYFSWTMHETTCKVQIEAKQRKLLLSQQASTSFSRSRSNKGLHTMKEHLPHIEENNIRDGARNFTGNDYATAAAVYADAQDDDDGDYDDVSAKKSGNSTLAKDLQQHQQK